MSCAVAGGLSAHPNMAERKLKWIRVALMAAVIAVLATPLTTQAAAAADSTGGYNILTSSGGIYTFGTAAYEGNLIDHGYPGLAVGVAGTPSGHGYNILNSAGAIYSFGDAPYYGNLLDHGYPGPAVALSMTPSGRGYAILTAFGGVYTFGDAIYFGNLLDHHYPGTAVSFAYTSTGAGYSILTSSGALYTFGDAKYFGNLLDHGYPGPASSLAYTRDNAGYFILTSFGGIYTFGDAVYMGNLLDHCYPGPAVSLATTPGTFTGTTAGACGAQPPPPPPPPAPAPGPQHFGTVPPGGALPTGAQCASWVRGTPIAENKGMNAGYNQTTGQGVGAMFPGDDSRADQWIAPRIDGQFTGTTHQILRWAACKWGIDEDIVAAQAAKESWWRQTNLGDWGMDPTRCPPGHGLGADGRPGLCPESWGILQNRYPYETSTWPGIGNSTAMNADTAYGIWRSCFEGYETWLPSGYGPGDAWGCVGRWFSGSWHDPGANSYIASVQDYVNQRIWEQPNFQEP
ncbi:MAG TPA: hypothetical protein VKI64_06380 [Acidimicrobiales bacterium]|nr:hypothetical protein [Acidimicrobiales bacterium]